MKLLLISVHFDNENLLGAVGKWEEFVAETEMGRKWGAQVLSCPCPSSS